MQVETIGTEQFRALGLKFRKAANGVEVRKALTKTIRAELDPAVKDVKSAVLALDVKTSRGGGSRQRAAHYHAARARKTTRAHFGLRAAVARGVKSRVKYSGYTVGARIYEDTSALPEDQRKLPRYLNRPSGWRHPVFGNRDQWVHQVGGEWFEPPIRKRVVRIRAGVVQAVSKTLKELQA